MRVFALAISWISIVYCAIEGGVSIGLGAEVGSRALIVFGVQSVVEILSPALVIYRFHRELDGNASPNLSLERRATLGIGILFIILTIGTWVASIIALANHDEPDSSIPSLIVSACSLVLMIFVWLPKPWIATELNSSVMRAEAACSLACIYLTIVLLIGSLVYKI
jgi:divalent metal cation (Fe/Co/Zn/Cd) transporter